MGISDILTLIGLLFAIFAFIYEGEGEFIFIKFNWLDVAIIVLALLLLNYLIYYDFYLEKGLVWKALYFTWGLNPSTWAYILSLGIIGYLFFRIFFGAIPFSNRDKLINFYKRLVNKGDFDKVMGYIEKYHEKMVFQYHAVFKKNQHLQEVEYEKADSVTQFRLMRGDANYRNRVSYSRQEKLAGSVYRWIIERDDFIDATANEFPYFYSEIYKYFNYTYSPNEETINSFFTTLLGNNNKFLKRELSSNVNSKEGERYNYRFEEDNLLLKSVFEDLKVAETTYVWKPFGEVAIQEIGSLEEDHFLFQLRNSDIHTDLKFLDLSIGKSIRFFDIMVRQAIYKKHGYHMWLPYYYHFVHDILEVTPHQEKFGIDDWRGDYPTNYLYLIYRITSNIYDWYHAMEDALYDGIGDTISKTMSGILLEISNSDSVGKDWSINQFKLFIKIYCEVSTAPLKEKNEEASKEINKPIAESIEKVMLRPAYGNDDEMKEYWRILKLAWSKFDRVPYEQLTVLNILQVNVFDKL
jgi:hypothetical protein